LAAATTAADQATLNGKIRQTNSDFNRKAQEARALEGAYAEIMAKVTELTTKMNTAKTALTNAKKLRDASDRKEAEANRARIKNQYTAAVNRKEDAQLFLDEFKEGFEGNFEDATLTVD